jgi:penicillin-binding protein 2
MDNLQIRGSVLIVCIGAMFLTFIVRLFSIQVLSSDYARKANDYVIRVKPIIPPRGNIYDRDVRIYVSNEPMFNMLVTPDEFWVPDTAVLVRLLGKSKEQIEAEIRKMPPRQESVFARYISPEVYGKLQEQLWNARGISFTASTKRSYVVPVGGNVLGYISEVSQQEIEAAAGKYLSGDLIGKAGIERSHDSTLRGIQGYRKVLKNVHNREVGSFAGGSQDRQATRGRDILLGIDTRLQQFGEELMQGKKGSIVAIEPSSGEILAFVSAPSYDPNLLTGSDLRENWGRLRSDTTNPLYNRPLMARYPPGSIFKLAIALAALNEGTITPETYYGCGGGFKRNRGKPGCRFHPSPLKLDGAIQWSCNSYFAATYMDFLHHDKFNTFYDSYDAWYKYMKGLGVGRTLGVDVPYEIAGNLPTAERYDKIYGNGRWMATNIISNAIGQGEIIMTPLQMANMVATIANRGRYTEPHFVRAVRDENSGDWIKLRHETIYSEIRREHFETVIDAMEQVVKSGTARRAYINDSIAVCGKTGTVQNPHGEDHAVFIGFAPKHNPQIAIAVVIENAGGGGSWAAPTASLMMEHYLWDGAIRYKQPEYERVRQARFIR